MLHSFLVYCSDHLEAVVTLIVAAVAVRTYWYTATHDRKSRDESKEKDRTLQRQQNYLALEFESIRVFQVCVEHPEIPLYLDGKDFEAASEPYISEKAYWFVCQVLNLFEIIISYRKDEIVPDIVFATWVSWFHELGTAPRFDKYWCGEELWSHYKKDLQEIMNVAVKLASRRSSDFESIESEYDDELEQFYREVGDILDDRSVLKHFTGNRKLNELARISEGELVA